MSTVPLDWQARRSGWLLFASIMILIGGIFNVFDGIFGFFRSAYWIGKPIGGSLWIWALVLLLFGVVEILAGLGVMSGQSWARWFAIVVVGLNLLAHLGAIALYPLWSVVMIAIDILIIFGLTAGWHATASATTETAGPVPEARTPRL